MHERMSAWTRSGHQADYVGCAHSVAIVEDEEGDVPMRQAGWGPIDPRRARRTGALESDALEGAGHLANRLEWPSALRRVDPDKTRVITRHRIDDPRVSRVLSLAVMHAPFRCKTRASLWMGAPGPEES